MRASDDGAREHVELVTVVASIVLRLDYDVNAPFSQGHR
jgi:hypothetical protein